MADDAKNLIASESAAASREQTGAKAIAAALKASGVEIVFGYAGGGTNVLIDGVVTSGLRTLSARTEISAAWMSYGYNRIKKRAASACIFHCVGALHATPVVYAATQDSTPFMMMDVGLDSAVDLREALQDSNQVFPTLKQVAKYARKVVLPDDLPLAVRQAVIAASTGRQGSSVLDLAFQVLPALTTCKVEPLMLPEAPAIAAQTLAAINAKIAASQRPVLFIGAGVQSADAAAELRAFAEKTGIPVVSSAWGGRGVLPDTHPLYAGVMGAFGWINANDCAQRADLWITVGVSFSQMTTAAWNIEKPAEVVQIDIDPNQLGKIFQPTLGVVADAKQALIQLIAEAEAGRLPNKTDPQRQAAIQADKQEWFEYLHGLAKPDDKPINQYFLFEKMSEILPEGAIVVADSGMHAFMMYRAFRYLAPTPQLQGSRYMSLGSGLPTAIGGKLASPESTVVCFHGDGGLYYSIADLSILSQHGLKIILIIDNNGYLAANRASAIMMGLENPWVDLPHDKVDFVTVAKGMGVEAERVTDPLEFEGALRRALEAKGSYVLDVITDPDTRIKRAVKDVVPIISDRRPQTSGEGHVSPTQQLRKAWPS